MPAFISPLDGNYISLKRAALLIAREQPGIEPDDIMELFKHAIFTCEFEREACGIHGIGPTDDRNLPLVRIEAPPGNGFVPRLPLDAQPQEFFAVKSQTVAENLSERDALPGSAEDSAAFAQFPRSEGVMSDMLRALAHIPYSTFPARAQTILGDILLAKGKLQAWMMFKGYELPAFLRDLPPPADCGHPKSVDDPVDKPPRGRPRKPGWTRVEQLVREDARCESGDAARHAGIRCLQASGDRVSQARPAVLETVLRHMKAILLASRLARPIP